MYQVQYKPTQWLLNKQKPNTPEYINSSNYQLNNQPTYKLTNL